MNRRLLRIEQDTYNAPYPDGTISQGGYASHVRAHEYFTFQIPDNISSHLAAPMVFPLDFFRWVIIKIDQCSFVLVSQHTVHWLGLKQVLAKRSLCLECKYRLEDLSSSAISMIKSILSGGLGHFGLLWASALGAETYALSHSPDKEKDALALGAKEFICTNDKDWAKSWAFTFDFILNTADMTHTFNLAEYMSTLAVNGTFHNVGLPDEPLPQLKAQDFAPNGAQIGASHIGSRPEILNMLKLASEKNITPYIQTLDVGEQGCKEAVERVKINDVRYRLTLVNFDKAFAGRD